MRTRRGLGILVTAAALTGLVGSTAAPASAATTPSAKAADATLDTALNQFVASSGGAPGIAVVVGRGATPQLHTAGTAILAQASSPTPTDQMRLASVAKAFSGAVALSLVKDQVLSLTDTVGRWLPSLPQAWQQVTLSQLLNHTGGVPDFSKATSFQQALPSVLLTPPPPSALLTYVADQPLDFKPGSRYQYSNSDNIIIGLMAQAATGHSYEALVQERVSQPFGLVATSLPRDAAIPSPFIHGYQLQPGQPPEDVSELVAAGWSWASGGIISTPADANRFIRAYVRGAETTRAARSAQFRFIDRGTSEPPGPGTNAAGLAIFRYTTPCGTVYGHTGNTPGYTQFIAATRDGSRSVTVSANTQLTPKGAAAPFAALRKIDGLAVCAALAGAR
ncbi:MAG TPA: serine hydrolase domain-containing protein [Acidimicrobiia bacterium]|nr:serine hydrolase domain-containing protein [Acidimicrobiia bacterium]